MIAGNVRLLDRVQRGIDRWVGVPEVSIPLNHDAMIWQERVNDKLAANNLLLQVGHAETVKNDASCCFKRVVFFDGRKAQNSVDTLHIGMVVTASVTAILYWAVEPPSRNVERLTTGNALLNGAAATNPNRVFSRLFLCLNCLLPSVSAFHRAKSDSAATAGDKRFTTTSADIGAAIVTPPRKVRTRQERMPALIAFSCLIGHVFHTMIIPWMVAICK